MKRPTSVTLTGNGSTPWHETEGTLVQVRTSGDFGGGSAEIEIEALDGTPVPVVDDSNEVVSLTVPQARNIEVPARSRVRVTLSGATSPDLLASILEVSDGRSQY